MLCRAYLGGMLRPLRQRLTVPADTPKASATAAGSMPYPEHAALMASLKSLSIPGSNPPLSSAANRLISSERLSWMRRPSAVEKSTGEMVATMLVALCGAPSQLH